MFESKHYETGWLKPMTDSDKKNNESFLKQHRLSQKFVVSTRIGHAKTDEAVLNSGDDVFPMSSSCNLKAERLMAKNTELNRLSRAKNSLKISFTTFACGGDEKVERVYDIASVDNIEAQIATLRGNETIIKQNAAILKKLENR
ncbi:MAG: hypothetical protein K9G62_00185 [Alphaproteobacteria bacterium]|nr:hypothetical protein [Alphaproteobacteria bacterium]